MVWVSDAISTATSKFNRFYLVPLFGLVCWYAMCLGLIGSWVSHGSKSYPKYDETSTPIPMERIGVILEPAFFITFVVIHAIVFCVSIYMEFYHRKIGKLIKFIKPDVQKRLAFASIFFGIIAQLFFIAQAVVGAVFIHKHKRKESHYAILLATFGILIMVSLALNFTNYYIMGQYYRRYVNGDRWNKFTISFIIKIVWLFVTIGLAVTTCVFYIKNNQTVSAIFEWIFHLWYGLLLAFWTYDLYPLTELRALRNKSNGEVEVKESKLQQIKKKLTTKSITGKNQTFVGRRLSEDIESIEVDLEKKMEDDYTTVAPLETEFTIEYNGSSSQESSPRGPSRQNPFVY
ncbi:Frag1/DRAM/Sfk1 family-domain-containing protein [Scheffersomyces xylosifermentans]|uniref:Frag1/DRAM/Sfk1 family-domain-containing protein n=1 Tax=Scheffersomyces xylosifermentans TaxID=1304137 RepID=UPI00315C6F9B